MLNQKPSLKSTLYALLYLAPLLLITAVFTLWPLFQALAMSFYDRYNYFTGHVGALNLANFRTLWQDATFHLALRNTGMLVLCVVPATVLLALGLALLLNRVGPLHRLFQAIYLLPFVTATVAISLVWNWIFRQDTGLLDVLLQGVGGPSIDWLNDPHYALGALVIVCIWKGLGFNVLLFQAGLANLDRRYLAAATVDGATPWQRFWTITGPLLTPMTLLITVNATIGSFKAFDQVYALFHQTAGPANADLTVLYYLYQKFYVENHYALAAASGLVFFALTVGVTLLGLLWRHHFQRLGGDG